MPKKQTRKKNFKLSWKIVAFSSLGLVLALGVAAQAWYNVVLFERVNLLEAENLRNVFQSQLKSTLEAKKNLGDELKIEEVKLQMASGTDEDSYFSHSGSSPANELLYFYDEGYKGEGGEGIKSSDWPESVHVTAKMLASTGSGHLYVNSTDEIFDKIDDAQACAKGFTIRFQEYTGNDQWEPTLVGQKKLADGRSMYLWRYSACDSGDSPQNGVLSQMMDKLEAYLLQAQSY